MTTSYMDYTNPNVQYFFDLNQNRLFTRNANNFINRLGRDNLNTLGDVSILDIYLSKGHVVEPHYHPNAAELVLVRRALEPLHNETIIIGPTDAFI